MKQEEKKFQENGKRYLVVFRLSSDLLKQYYRSINIKQSWDDISRFMKSNGFEHLKDTTYISKAAMSEPKFFKTISSLVSKYPWLYLSNDVFKCYSVDKEFSFADIVKGNYGLLDRIHLLEQNPPGQNRGLSSAQPPAAPSGKQRQPPAPPVPPVQQNPDTVTVSISELKEYFEADVELQVTVKKSDLEQAKKQAEAKKQSNTKSGGSEKSEEPPTQSKPKPTHKPKR